MVQGPVQLVAWKLGRRFIGIDVSRQYCDTALARIKMAAGGNDAIPGLSFSRTSCSGRSPGKNTFLHYPVVSYFQECLIVT